MEVRLVEIAIEKLKIGWTHGAAARNEAGQGVPVSDSRACQWCMLGGLMAATNALPGSIYAYDSVVRKLAAHIRRGEDGYLSKVEEAVIPRWNDAAMRTRDQVIAKLVEFKATLEAA